MTATQPRSRAPENIVHSHPHRRTITKHLMEQGPASPVTISRAHGIRLGTVAYHMRVMASAGVITSVARRRRRGAMETTYDFVDRDNVICRICGLPQERDGLCAGHREEWIQWASRRPSQQNDEGFHEWIADRRRDIYQEN